ncbi:DNA/RNA non-specific endonuclease [Bordetella petrii]|uniref:DNA/RNA non-specific endonuclease n=1 Tax=Bordetella petrii TaxID=94624 RepID=UPI001E5C8394|nr:DNA/RNA non-specific endonuclease [Bordetella petrii]MCD0502518.1 DNA/RNA non-specific endonuclease [Bordetella petrii]
MPRKKSVSRKRSPGRRAQARSAGSAARFLRALLLSSVASFGAATYWLNPQWRIPASVEQALARLPWPALNQAAPVAAPAGAQAQTTFAQCPEFFPQARPPAVPASQKLREVCYASFAILHNGQTKTPVFVAERLNRRSLLQARQQDRTDRFYAEARIPRSERAELDDYRGSGFSRGHMAPAADMATPQAMAQSFSLANMVPQDQVHNGGPWSRIEQDTRKYAMRAAGDVYVFTGPVYADRPRTIGAGVAVPSYLYKVVYDATTGRSWVHWQANSADTKAGPPISYGEFVRRTGLRLLSEAG